MVAARAGVEVRAGGAVVEAREVVGVAAEEVVKVTVEREAAVVDLVAASGRTEIYCTGTVDKSD